MATNADPNKKVKSTKIKPVNVETQQRPKTRVKKPQRVGAGKVQRGKVPLSSGGSPEAKFMNDPRTAARVPTPESKFMNTSAKQTPSFGTRAGRFAKSIPGRAAGAAGGLLSTVANPITVPFIAEALSDQTPREAGGTVASTVGKIGRDLAISARDIFSGDSPEEIARLRDENYNQSFGQLGMPQTEVGGAQDYIDWRGGTPAFDSPVTPAQAAAPIAAPVVEPVASPVASTDPAAADTGYRQVVDPQGRITLTNRPGNAAVNAQVASDRERGVAGAFEVGGNVQEVFNTAAPLPASLGGDITDLTQNKFTGVDAHGISDPSTQGGNIDTIRHAGNVINSDTMPIQSQVKPRDTARVLSGTGTDITGGAAGSPQGGIQAPVNTNAPFMASPVSQPGTVNMAAGPDGSFEPGYVPPVEGARPRQPSRFSDPNNILRTPSPMAANQPKGEMAFASIPGNVNYTNGADNEFDNRERQNNTRNTAPLNITQSQLDSVGNALNAKQNQKPQYKYNPEDSGFINALAQGFDLAGEATTGAGAIGRANQARGLAASSLEFDDTQRALANRENRTAIDQSKLGLDQQRVNLAEQQFAEGAPARAAEVAQKEARTAAMVQQTTAFNSAVDQYGLDAAMKLVNPADKVMAAQMKQAADIAETLAMMPGYSEMTPDELFKQAMSTVVETQEKISSGYRYAEATPAVPASSGIPFLPFDSTEAQKATYAWQK